LARVCFKQQIGSNQRLAFARSLRFAADVHTIVYQTNSVQQVARETTKRKPLL